MEYNLFDNTPNQPSKFRLKNLSWNKWDGSSRTYRTGSQIKLKTPTIRSSLRDHSDVYILAKETATVENTAADSADPNNRDKK